VKILGVGDLTKALTISAHGFSKSAREKVEKAGGSIVWLRGEPVPKKVKKRKARPAAAAEEEPEETPETPGASADEAPAEEADASEEAEA
jgi:hypothetical protein